MIMAMISDPKPFDVVPCLFHLLDQLYLVSQHSRDGFVGVQLAGPDPVLQDAARGGRPTILGGDNIEVCKGGTVAGAATRLRCVNWIFGC